MTRSRKPRRFSSIIWTCLSATTRTRLNLKKSLTSRSEEHTSELQSQSNLVCRLLLEKKTRLCPPDCRSEGANLVSDEWTISAARYLRRLDECGSTSRWFVLLGLPSSWRTGRCATRRCSAPQAMKCAGPAASPAPLPRNTPGRQGWLHTRRPAQGPNAVPGTSVVGYRARPTDVSSVFFYRAAARRLALASLT